MYLQIHTQETDNALNLGNMMPEFEFNIEIC
jgi:hypothetical protein